MSNRHIKFFDEDNKDGAEIVLEDILRWQPKSKKRIHHLAGSYSKHALHSPEKTGGWIITTLSAKQKIENKWNIGLIDTPNNRRNLSKWWGDMARQEKMDKYDNR